VFYQRRVKMMIRYAEGPGPPPYHYTNLVNNEGIRGNTLFFEKFILTVEDEGAPAMKTPTGERSDNDDDDMKVAYCSGSQAHFKRKFG
jgi:hypothetical protein